MDDRPALDRKTGDTEGRRTRPRTRSPRKLADARDELPALVGDEPYRERTARSRARAAIDHHAHAAALDE
jgi:hypothetical protein